MKRLLLFLPAIIILPLISVYIFIPPTIRVSNNISLECTTNGLSTVLQQYEKWGSWWPQKEAFSIEDSSYIYKDYRYKLITPLTDGAIIDVSNSKDHFETRMIIIPQGRDSVTLEWQANFISGINPFKRISQYFKAAGLKKNMHEVLGNLKTFAGETENIYGFPIQRTTFTDTVLLATKFSTGTYPSNEIIYKAINLLKKKITDAGAEEKDFPMLNVKKSDSNTYETMIAICINKRIKTDPDFFISLMVPMKDRFLATEVTGGPFTLQKAHEAIVNYMDDHFLSAPAIPFEILITDRSREMDTSKWKTKIFYPSM